MVNQTLTQIAVAIPVAVVTGLFVLTYSAAISLGIDVPLDVLGQVWA